MIKLLLFFLVINGCSLITRDKEIVLYNNKEVEKEFIPHIKTFEKACNKKVEIEIKFSTLNFFPIDAIGICFSPYLPSFIKRVILIDRDWWDNWNEYSGLGEELILHELGHCVLDRLHNEEVHSLVEKYQRPTSIMYPSIFGYWGWYESYREEYLKELCEDK
jgi:hypothetical protein